MKMVFQPIPEWSSLLLLLQGLGCTWSPTSPQNRHSAWSSLNEAHGYRSSHPTCQEVRDGGAVGIYKDIMGFKWFNQQSIRVICGKPKMFIEVGDELWHWFYMFYQIIGVERKTHFKDKFLSHWYTSNETQLQRWTFKLKSEGTQKSEKKHGHTFVLLSRLIFGPPKSHGRHPPGFVQKCGKYSSQLLRCWSFFSIWFAAWTYLPAVRELCHATGWSAWIIVPINSQHGQSQLPCNRKCVKHF